MTKCKNCRTTKKKKKKEDEYKREKQIQIFSILGIMNKNVLILGIEEK